MPYPVIPAAHLRLYPVSAIRAMETANPSDSAEPSLMERAAAAATRLVTTLMPEPGAVLILAGPGNNGGDAALVAAQLASAGYSVDICALLSNTMSADSQSSWQRCAQSQAKRIQAEQLTAVPGYFPYQLIIDGLFGIGLSRPVSGLAAELIRAVNRASALQKVPVIALDVPSGLNADTGAVIGGEQGIAIRASHTLSFLGNKPGLHTADAKDYAGHVIIDFLEASVSADVRETGVLNCANTLPAMPVRASNSHKGSFGDVLIAGGAAGMSGAVLLAARTALFSGAGRVYAGMLEAIAVDFLHPELMCRPLMKHTPHKEIIVAGPGLGQSETASHELARLIAANRPMVLDADALNLLAQQAQLQSALQQHSAEKILTPHPLEAARLLNWTVAEVQADRIAAASELAHRYQSVIILKGAGSVLCQPGNAQYRINTSGNPALATGGTGDVLAGLCGALLAQGLAAWDAACLACWLHGTAADDLCLNGTGPVGLTASELIPAIRRALNQHIALGQL
ncbi:NAD(P)H-hydrate dehydratase [Undibacterium luofuense]|uniref:Bifunctional NAD(P)H-hydrate repair enzyme n=1 Tax=Undibacterium luofuense TaxID=2828733 RepID=A0A941I7T8_9BURK|nr:NAD(P)H-hydrate dehydratase [Undibacterium luofuense]MBR7783010.1 NAD(P)H-hydrate dehydratase [Undibacterium luofuense]